MLLLCGCAAEPVETTVATTTEPVQTEPTTTAAPTETVGICLPDKSVQRWVDEAADMEAILTEYGYKVQILYAEGNPSEQALQVESLVEQGVKCLIIAAVDWAELVEAGEMALEANIPVVAYDRLLMDTAAVSAYVGFHYQQIGRDMGAYIEQAKLLPEAEQPYTVEFFMGSPEDPNALALYQGLMEHLQPYLEDETLVSKTGRTAFEDCCIVGWDDREAGGRFSRYLAEDYSEALPDIVCTAADTMAAGCISNIWKLDTIPETLPLVTGVGGTLVKGQSITFPLDTRVLAEPAATIAHQLITGQDLTVTDPEGCDNRAKTVPAWFAETTWITK